jgi:DNA-binding NarL/FixJ family response regulator
MSNIIPEIILKRCFNSDIKTNNINSLNQSNSANIKVTKREQDCIDLLLTGATACEIAQKLNLSTRTIETYVAILKSKFNARNKADLIVKLCELSATH